MRTLVRMTNAPRVTRRIAFQGLGALGVAAALAGCAGSDNGGGAGSGSGTSPTVDSGAELATTADVPVGGGLILTDAKIVLTQPSAGDFQAFTAVCTHQGFLVGRVEDGVITCEHHGSEYSAEDGSVEQGPASSGLAPVKIQVKDDKIFAA